MRDFLAGILRRIADRLDNEFGITEAQFNRMRAQGDPFPVNTTPTFFYINGVPARWSDDDQAFVTTGATS